MNETCPQCGGTGSLISGKDARLLRKGHGLTLAKLSAKMGISLPYLADLEKGRRRWNSELAAKLKKATK